jgi:hypothetical protein
LTQDFVVGIARHVREMHACFVEKGSWNGRPVKASANVFFQMAESGQPKVNRCSARRRHTGPLLTFFSHTSFISFCHLFRLAILPFSTSPSVLSTIRLFQSAPYLHHIVSV